MANNNTNRVNNNTNGANNNTNIVGDDTNISQNILYFNRMMIALSLNLLEYLNLQTQVNPEYKKSLEVLLNNKNLKDLSKFFEVNSQLWEETVYDTVYDNYNFYNQNLFQESAFYPADDEKIREFIDDARQDSSVFKNFNRLYLVMNLLSSYSHNVQTTNNIINSGNDVSAKVTNDLLLKMHQNNELIHKEFEDYQKKQSNQIKKSKKNLIIISSVLGTLVLICILSIIHLIQKYKK